MTDSRRLVLLVQLPIPPSGIQLVCANLPLAAACLQLYAQRQGLDRRYRIEILPPGEVNVLGDQGLVEAIAARRPWMVGFSCFLWNADRTLWLAQQLKERLPETLCALGGPEATLDNHRLLAASCLDYVIVGEGEQTFAELLQTLDCETRGLSVPAIAGAMATAAGPASFRPRAAMDNLDAIASPYLAGIIEPDEQGLMMLETVRGCRYRCKFCYYPKSFATQRFLSEGKIAECLAYAQRRGVREVAILDPTLNQRRDFLDFIRLLARGNPQRTLRYSAELRAEGIDAEAARLLQEANFSEVEIGLQSIDPQAQRLMGRSVHLDKFVDGVHSLMDAGICARVDLILGLPGDTVDSIRRGIDFLVTRKAYSEMQVFNLSVLPGTAFRREALELGLVYQDFPPYGVLQTPRLTLEDMAMLMEEAQEAFGVQFDAIAPPVIEHTDDGCGPLSLVRIDLDRDAPGSDLPAGRRFPGVAFTLWLRAADFCAKRREAVAWIDCVLAKNPHGTLQVVIDPTGHVQGLADRVLPHLHAACYKSLSYLDRYYSLHPGMLLGAKRLTLLLSAEWRARLGEEEVEAIGEYAVIVWRGSTPDDGLMEHEFLEAELDQDDA